LNIQIEYQTTLEARLTLQLEPEDYRPRVLKALKDLRKNLKMPGFRPGMVPEGLVKAQYGLPVLQEELGKIVNDSLMDYARTHQLDYFGQPLPVKGHNPFDAGLQDGLSYEFRYDLGLRPEVRIKAMETSMTKLQPIPNQEEVENTVDQWRSRYFEGAYPEVSQSGDRIFLRLTPTEGSGNGPAARKTVVLVELDEIHDPALREALNGKGKGQTGQLTPQDLYGDDLQAIAKGFKLNEGEDLDARTLFDYEISNVLREGKAELNSAFFEKVFGSSMDETEFREKATAFVRSQWDQEAEQLLRFQMMENFFEQHPMDLPDAFLQRLLKQNHDHDHNHDTQYEPFARQLRRDLLIEVLLREHEVQISREDLLQEAEGRLFRQFSGYGISPEQIPLRRYAEDYLRKEQNESSVYYSVKYQRAEDLLREQVRVVDQEVDYSSFKAQFDQVFGQAHA